MGQVPFFRESGGVEMLREEQKVLAVDWIHAVESGFFIVCDRCRALPF
jgi:hypothetical protein